MTQPKTKARYLQIADEIETELLPTLGPGAKLPSTAQLAERYGAHRLTVRQGLDVLIRRGLLVSHQGAGTFTRDKARRYEVSTDRTASLSESMRAEGRKVVNRLLGHTIDASPPRHVAFDVTAPPVRIDTFRIVDDQPWSLTATWFHPKLFPDIVSQWPGSGSLSALLSANYGIRMVREHRSFAAVPADVRASEFLGIGIGEPALRVRGSNVDANTGQVIIAVEHLFAGDSIEFVTNLR